MKWLLRVWIVPCLLLSGMSAFGQSVGQIAEHFPADSRFALVSADLGATCAEFQQTRVGQTLTGPNFAVLIDHLRRHELGGPLNLRPIFGFDWRELQEVHQPGGLAVFSGSDGGLSLVWIFVGSASQDETTPLPMASLYFTSQGFSLSTDNRAGTQITTLRPPAGREQERTRVLFAAQGFYGIADSPEAADRLLSQKPGTSLASDPLWQNTLRSGTTAEPRPGDVTLFLRPFELWEMVRKNNSASESQSAADVPTATDASDASEPDPLVSARQLGFDGVLAVAGQLTFPASAARDWELSVRLITPRPFKNAMRLLELKPGAAPPIPDFLSANVNTANFWRWDFPTAMRGFGNLFDQANEPGPDGVGLFEDMLDGLRDDPEGVQVDLRREVFENLGPNVMSFTDRGGPQTDAQPDGDRTLYDVQVRDQAMVADALRRFYHGDERVTYQRRGQYDVWTVPEGSSLFVEGESDSVVSVRALALGKNRMLVGTDAELLHTTLEGGSPSERLKDDDGWLALWNGMQQRGEASLWGLSRLEDTMAPEYAKAVAPEVDENAGVIASLWRILLFGTTAAETEVPYDFAPPFDQVRPALSRAGVLMSPLEEGWNVTISAERTPE